ncbi:hypothetical protein KIPB_001006 [Kipferlia bialata]|uniref:Uncharacterized protein n=1 Tax=Kipferlia bialata TaxID=797122 RepID=A0A391NLK4_9EUKA|nr:hypothetical protein KIPB_001001 [Kipferlia bialata]GCA62070.1 hypothetical protein KIPB_001006 [Kipferlia bialata]|eukprot:g1001.t1
MEDVLLELPEDTCYQSTQATFVLENCIYRVEKSKTDGEPCCLKTYRFDPDAPEYGWVELDTPTPDLQSKNLNTASALAVLPGIGGRAYAVTYKEGNILSFSPASGWIEEKCQVTRTSVPVGQSRFSILSDISCVGVGQYLFISQELKGNRAIPVSWLAYDTISGDITPLQVDSGETCVCGKGMFTAALALRSTRPHALHFVDTSFVYPQEGRRWAVSRPL